MVKPHKAKAVVITCMDFRFQNAVRKYMKKKNLLGHSDRIVVAGGSRDFIIPVKEQHKDYVWTQLNLSLELHNPTKIIIIDHQDCGGYAQDGLIPKGLILSKDKRKHISMLKKLKRVILKKFPKKKVKFVYLGLDDSIEELDL